MREKARASKPSLPSRRGGETFARMKRILRDIQFWIPVVVLIGGLMVLTWIH
jgi:hypothetical protein